MTTGVSYIHFTILTLVLLQVFEAMSLECFVCSSLDDEKCKDTPQRKVVCAEYSTGCVKITVKDFEYDTRFVMDNENHRRHADPWDKENGNLDLIPKCTDVVVRNCEISYTRLEKQLGCRQVLDIQYNITTCKCDHDLCNNAQYIFVNPKAYITLVVFCIKKFMKS